MWILMKTIHHFKLNVSNNKIVQDVINECDYNTMFSNGGCETT